MNRSPLGHEETIVVLLAAGEGCRFGTLKQLAIIDDEPMVRRVAHTLLRLQRPVLVMTGAGGEAVAAALAGLSVTCIENADWRDGLGASLGAGIRAVSERFPGASAALVCLADHPLLDARALRAMIDRHARKPERIFAADHAGKPGPPVLFPADCFPELAAWHGAEGAQAWLRRQGPRVERVPLDVTDVDTPADLDRVRQRLTQVHGCSTDPGQHRMRVVRPRTGST
ncbi:MAG TPA: nucleotidyltransferase family protein [Rhodanobacteraceae bacterium]|nr:nucleotidyltransferase family protein [Rhodanobacteraceae bacterium]